MEPFTVACTEVQNQYTQLCSHTHKYCARPASWAPFSASPVSHLFTKVQLCVEFAFVLNEYTHFMILTFVFIESRHTCSAPPTFGEAILSPHLCMHAQKAQLLHKGNWSLEAPRSLLQGVRCSAAVAVGTWRLAEQRFEASIWSGFCSAPMDLCFLKAGQCHHVCCLHALPDVLLESPFNLSAGLSFYKSVHRVTRPQFPVGTFTWAPITLKRPFVLAPDHDLCTCISLCTRWKKKLLCFGVTCSTSSWTDLHARKKFSLNGLI